jgi:hypothetical protein
MNFFWRVVRMCSGVLGSPESPLTLLYRFC